MGPVPDGAAFPTGALFPDVFSFEPEHPANSSSDAAAAQTPKPYVQLFLCMNHHSPGAASTLAAHSAGSTAPALTRFIRGVRVLILSIIQVLLSSQMACPTTPQNRSRSEAKTRAPPMMAQQRTKKRRWRKTFRTPSEHGGSFLVS